MKRYKIRLRDAATADGALRTVTDALADATPLGDEPQECALFSRAETDATVIFVSPQFAKTAPQLVEGFSGVEWVAPPPPKKGEGFGAALLLAANSDCAWSLLR